MRQQRDDRRALADHDDGRHEDGEGESARRSESGPAERSRPLVGEARQPRQGAPTPRLGIGSGHDPAEYGRARRRQVLVERDRLLEVLTDRREARLQAWLERQRCFDAAFLARAQRASRVPRQ